MPTLSPDRFRRDVRLPPVAVTAGTAEWIDWYAERHGITRSEVIRAALAMLRDRGAERIG